MKEFIGHRLKLLVDNFPGPIDGVLVGDHPQMMMIKGSDGKIFRVVKSRVSGFVPVDGEVVDYRPFQVLFCDNEKTKCPGVQFIQEGEGVARKDFDKFMSPCPCKVDTCKFGTKGELRSVSSKFLQEMLVGAVFGEYPAKEIKDANGKSTEDKS